MVYRHSPMATGEGAEILQPLPFNHQHHVQGLGLDCRYCHTAVEKSAKAGFPDAATCYGCHSEIWKSAPMLDPVRKSVEENHPLYWFQVNRLPDYVYFDHSIHINKGIGCVSCHGEVSQQALITQQRSFLMRDCLECHEAPEKNLRPRAEITNDQWRATGSTDQEAELVRLYNVRPPPITNCNVCHR